MPLPFGLALPARPPLSIAATETAWPRVGVVPGEVLSDQMGRGGVGAAGVCAVVRTRAGEHSSGPPLPSWRWWSRAPRGCPRDGEGRLMSWCHGTSPGLEASLVRLPVVSLQPVCLRVVLAARSLLPRHCFSGASPQGQHALFPSLHPSFPPVCQRATLLWSR